MSIDAFFLQHFQFGWVAVASGISVVGIVLLYRAWRRIHRQPVLLLVGWSTLIFSLWPWQKAAGVDVGPTLGILVMILTALALTAGRANWRFPATRNTRRPVPEVRRASSPARRTVRYGRGIFRALLAGPVSLAAACSLVILIYAVVPEPAANRTMTAGLLGIVAAASAMAWSSADPRLLRPAIVLTPLALPGLVLLVLAA